MRMGPRHLAFFCWILLIENVLSQQPDVEGESFFEHKVRPLLIEIRLGCHSGDAEKPNGGLRLDGREAALAGGDNGPALDLDQPDQSLLIRAIRYQDSDIQMPPDGKLSGREIAVLENWIRRGLPYPGPSSSARP